MPQQHLEIVFTMVFYPSFDIPILMWLIDKQRKTEKVLQADNC